MSRRLLVVLAVAGVAATGAAIALVVVGHGVDFRTVGLAEGVLQNVIAGIWIAAGLIAWQRRPDNRVGPLMTGIGFLDVAQDLFWNASLPFTLGLLVPSVAFPMIVHLFVAFPGGRLTTRFERAFVGFSYATNLVLWLLLALFWDAHSEWPYSPADGPSNLLLVDNNSAVFDALNGVVAIGLIAVFVTLAVLLVRRVRRARGPTRRALAPVLCAVAVTLVLFSVASIADAAGADTASIILNWLTDAAAGAIPVAFLVGLLRTRLQRFAVADLVVAVSGPLTPAQLRDALSRTLRDESLVLAFWLPDRACYVDADGETFEPNERPGRAVTVIEHDGHRLAAMVHDPALLDDPALVESVSAAASLALENARLQAELRAQLNEVRASRARILRAGDAERRRVERDLHDGAQQRLLGIRLALQLVRGRLADEGATVDDLLAEADTEVVAALDELRCLARGIHPALLTEEGLDAALGALARRMPVPVELDVCGGRLPPLVEATVYFVASEALANVVKHAHATRATIDVTRANGHVAVAVTDDGVGGADPDGAGLHGLRDRVETIDGHLCVDSVPGHGTLVTAAIPCA
jgi:signal transduction histidine kinase